MFTMHPCSHRKLLQNTHASKNAHPFQNYVYIIIKGYKTECVFPRLKQVIHCTFFKAHVELAGSFRYFKGKTESV